MGIWPTSLHVFCDFGKGIKPFPLGDPVWRAFGLLSMGSTVVAIRLLYKRSLHFLQMMWFCLHVLGQFAAECEGAGMRISTSKFRVIVLDQK